MKKTKEESLESIRDSIREAKPLFEEGVLTIDDILNQWMKTIDLLGEWITRAESHEVQLGLYREELFRLQREGNRETS
jgi:hypothetical protein